MYGIPFSPVSALPLPFPTSFWARVELLSGSKPDPADLCTFSSFDSPYHWSVTFAKNKLYPGAQLSSVLVSFDVLRDKVRVPSFYSGRSLELVSAAGLLPRAFSIPYLIMASNFCRPPEAFRFIPSGYFAEQNQSNGVLP